MRDFVARSRSTGSLHDRSDDPVARETGAAIHRELQRDATAGAESGLRAEVGVHGEFRVLGVTIRLGGRIDLLDCRRSIPRLEEIKVSHTPPLVAAWQRSVQHWAQLKVYGALYALQCSHGGPFVLQVRTVDPQTRTEYATEERFERTALLDELTARLTRVAAEVRALKKHQALRDRALTTLAFPYPSLRPQQRALLHTTARACVTGEHLLLDAATGLGKTLSVLWPAVRHLSSGPYQHIQFLTAKRTGRRAAWQAVTEIVEQGLPLRVIELTAREVSCPVPDQVCAAETCSYAQNYYDKRDAALAAMRGITRQTPAKVQAVALAHDVCPHALARDLSRQADLVIADYFQLLDLQRPEATADTAVLVDEAHHLLSRARDQLSARLTLGSLQAATDEVADPAVRRLGKRILRRMLLRLPPPTTGTPTKRPQGGGIKVLSDSDQTALAEDLNQFLDNVLVAGFPLPSKEISDLRLVLTRWLTLQGRGPASDAMPQLRVTVLVDWHEEGVPGASAVPTLQLLCLDPGPFLAQTLERRPVSIRFSGTLRPLDLHRRLQGLTSDRAVQIASPYQSGDLRVLIIQDLPYYWRQRHHSLPGIVALLKRLSATHRGRILVSVPSFDALGELETALLSALALHDAGPRPVVCSQSRAMSDEQRTTWLEQFTAATDAVIGLIVAGGVFSESVDFRRAKLTGVVVLGVGIAPPSERQTLLARYYHTQGHCGQTVTQAQPAMARVAQLVGRVQRSPSDRGFACLIDERFAWRQYQQFFPDHWQPQLCSHRQVPELLADLAPDD
ncbi:MAG: helicase C-terminal domain-containing protein [Pseudomonadota bacterium]